MAMFIAYNCALSTTTSVGVGQSIATTNNNVTLQLQVPDSHYIELVEWGWTQDVATATSSLVEVASTDTATTLGTAHSTTTVKQLNSPGGGTSATASILTMATTGTSFGAATIVTNTTLRNAAHLYVPQAYVFQWPLGNYPAFGGSTAESFVQLRCKTTATVNVLAWMVWNEH